MKSITSKVRKNFLYTILVLAGILLIARPVIGQANKVQTTHELSSTLHVCNDKGECALYTREDSKECSRPFDNQKYEGWTCIENNSIKFLENEFSIKMNMNKEQWLNNLKAMDPKHFIAVPLDENGNTFKVTIAETNPMLLASIPEVWNNIWEKAAMAIKNDVEEALGLPKGTIPDSLDEFWKNHIFKALKNFEYIIDFEDGETARVTYKPASVENPSTSN